MQIMSKLLAPSRVNVKRIKSRVISFYSICIGPAVPQLQPSTLRLCCLGHTVDILGLQQQLCPISNPSVAPGEGDALLHGMADSSAWAEPWKRTCAPFFPL